MHKYQISELEAAGPMYKGVMKRAYEEKASPRMAIKAMCLSCVGYLRAEITRCTAFGCPLHAYRPYVEDGEIAAEASEV